MNPKSLKAPHVNYNILYFIILSYELQSKLLKGGYIGDYIGYYYRGY